MLCSSWLSAAINNVRFRRQVNSEVDGKPSEMSIHCISTPQSLNRSIPCMFESNQLSTPHRSNSYIDQSSRSRTAVVEPHNVKKNHSRDDSSARSGGVIDSGDCFNGNIRSYYASEIARAYTSPSVSYARYDCGDPPPYYLHRRSTQPEDGFYQFSGSSTPISSSSRCEFTAATDIQSGVTMLQRGNNNARPRDLRIIPTSPVVRVDDGVPKKRSGLSSNGRGFHNAQTTPVDEPIVSMKSLSNSRKMMVAPQPQSSHHRDRNELSKRSNNQMNMQRRQSSGAVIPAYSLSHHFDNHRCNESPTNFGIGIDQHICVDDRCSRAKPSDIRVSVLEQRVRELETAVITGQSPSTSMATTSFIIPVMTSKNSQLLRSPSGQFMVSSATSSGAQQLIAQEVVDRELEVDRLQSQLRKCYSRMELRQAQYDQEVNAFRRESEEAKEQLTKLKMRLSELEKECNTYREKAIAVDANRNSMIATSIEKLNFQEKEIAALKAELDKNAHSTDDLKKLKKEYEFIDLQNEALNTTLDAKEAIIRDLEDTILTMKMDTSYRLDSGSVTPKAEADSCFSPDISTLSYSSRDLNSNQAGVNAVPKSLSVNHLSSSCDGRQQLSPFISKLIRQQLSTTLECRLLAKCLKDCASKAISGDAPSVNRLLGCRSDSMSESEPEPVMVDAHPMPVSSAERHIKKTTEDLDRIEKDLNSLRESFVEYYQKKIADELKEDDACRIQ